MKKMPTIYLRNPDNRKLLLNEPHPDCGWVFNGEGRATRKYDGTCVMIEHDFVDGTTIEVMTRREVKPGKQRPKFFQEISYDEVTGKRMGWEPYRQSPFANQIIEALGGNYLPNDWPEGTYELCGPKINGNSEGYSSHTLVRHNGAENDPYFNTPPAFEDLPAALQDLNWEGLVWHHPDGRMAKIKLKDFGLTRT